jgi:hypothetical protein
MLIDKYLRDYHFHKLHQIEIHAQPQDIFTAIDNTDFYQSKVISLLFTLRRLPSNFFSPEGYSKVGIMELEEKAGEESLLGAIFNPLGFKPVNVTPDEFREFDDKGYVKVVMNLHVSRIDEKRSLLSTESRVYYTSRKALLVFTPYWLLLNRFIGLVRIVMLRMLKQEAEKLSKEESQKS